VAECHITCYEFVPPIGRLWERYNDGLGEKVRVCQENLLAARTMQKLDDGSGWGIVVFVYSSSVATT